MGEAVAMKSRAKTTKGNGRTASQMEAKRAPAEPTPPAGSAPPAPAASDAGGKGQEITPERIRQRAFEIFQARGGAPGDPEADWLRAERELRAEAGSGAGGDTPADGQALEVKLAARGEALLKRDELGSSAPARGGSRKARGGRGNG
jgi:hypothetical protein